MLEHAAFRKAITLRNSDAPDRCRRPGVGGRRPCVAVVTFSFIEANVSSAHEPRCSHNHFEFSNQSALVAGTGVGAEVLATSLLRTRGATHAGGCPL